MESEKSLPHDTLREQLGWYIRNCALSPMARLLEPLLLGQVGRLRKRQGSTLVELSELETPLSGRDLNRHRRSLQRVLQEYAVLPVSDDSMEVNVSFAGEEFGLDEIDIEILLLLLRYEHNDDLEGFADNVLQRLGDPGHALAALLGCDRRSVRQRIAADCPLVCSGLVHLGRSNVELAGRSGCFQLALRLRRTIRDVFASRQEWALALVGPPVETLLQWEDFGHLGSARDLAAKVVNGAVKAEASGINILLHGAVGTGKTEFAKALASHTGMKMWSVGEVDGEGNEPSRYERLAELKVLQRLLAQRGNALILLDEAEDVLASDVAFGGLFGTLKSNYSKVYANRLIERNPIPIIWTCNNVHTFDPAILRRMTLALEVGTPRQPARARIWHRVLQETGLKLDAGAAKRLSSRYLAPPAVAANAARAAMLSGGGEAAVEEAMGGVLQLMGIGPCVAETDGCSFDSALINCTEDLAKLTECLLRPDASRQWSLCLHGAPGTGKSEFARYLAARLGMEVMQQRASDLLSMWVGDSEKRIATAFQAARARRAVLVIDEADSLLSDRRGAAQSWEVTQVNEMLTWMESHPLPFVCTTNLMTRLDQASLRRFTLKLRFDPMTPAQAELAFECFFGVAAPRRLSHGLSLGDFATVRRKRDLFGPADPRVLADWLDDEARAKETPGRPIGFLATRD